MTIDLNISGINVVNGFIYEENFPYILNNTFMANTYYMCI